MTRREELAQVRERDALMTPDWLPDGLPLWQRTNVADRRFLLGFVDELVEGLAYSLAALNDPEVLGAEATRRARRLLSDLGPDA